MMDQAEQDLWKTIDVGGFAAYGTLFNFTLESIKQRIEKGNKDVQDPRDKLNLFLKNITKRFQEMNLSPLDKRFPVDVLKELRDGVFPDMAAKFKELDSLLKYFVSGSSHLKGRIVGKIKECEDMVTRMGDLGIKFSRNDRYWEYRKTNPTRDYLEKPQE